MEKARELLLRGGFDEARVESRFANSQNTRTSDVILEELKAGGFSATVIGRHRLSRAEEFLFGSVAIRLARQATCPVWVVGEPSAEAPEDPAGATTAPDGATKEQG
jgi:nucleotide-binding universal stress UspA family protein